MKVKYSTFGISLLTTMVILTGCSSKNYKASVYVPYESSVVQVNTTGAVKTYETGWVVKGGYIITCYHGVRNDKSIEVHLFQNKNHAVPTPYHASIVHFDKPDDIALLQLTKPPANWPPAPITIANTVKKGQGFRMLGYMTKNKLRMNDGTVTKLHVKNEINQGYVNGTKQSSGTLENGLRVNVVATSGNTGSPLFNRDAKVIGIFEGNANATSKDNFAIPATVLSKLLSKWHV